jgi:hypothetical protein
MKNKYKIDGQTLIVYNRKDNKEMLFDVEDFDLVNRTTANINVHGYAQGYLDGKMQIIHRAVMKASKELQVDHMNGNRLDNRKKNLRLATSQINNHNNTVARGYVYDKRCNLYYARISINRKTIHIGSYRTEAEARAAYVEAKKKYHPTAPIRD